MSEKRLLGLIGYPLSHSFSRNYFQDKFEREGISGITYQNFEIENIAKVEKILSENHNLNGLNVTIPYKEKIIPYLDEIDEQAKKIGAVNTIRTLRNVNGWYLKGYNTDFYGFLTSLNKYLTGKEKKALIFGSGGASKAVLQAIKYLKINYKVISRKSNSYNTITYKEVSDDLISTTDILINTTPLGMWPSIDSAIDIPYSAIKKGSIAYDLIYNPKDTLFMQKCRNNGAIAVNGLEMLELQAEKAWEIFNYEV